MQSKAQIIVKSCNRRDLELSHVRNFLSGNNYAVEETEARQFISLDPAKISKEADLILLSTCGFSSVSEQYSLEAIEMVKRHMKPSAELIICGCLPSINPDGLKMYFEGQSFSPRSYEKLNEIINHSKSYEEFKNNNITNFYGKDVFTIQIHEGCPRNCSYCAIKLSIGQLKSTPLDEIMTQFKTGLAQGYKSFMFLGDCSGGYGLDIGSSFGELLGRVLDLQGDFTLSLTDIAPFYLPQCFNEIKELCSRKILPSFYIATQSANPRILQLMRRSFDMHEAKNMLLTLRNINPHLELITSIIVGFPSETPEEMEDTMVFCEEVGFNTIYCHGYSARPNVDSANLPGQHSLQEIKRRCKLAKERLKGMVSLVTIPGQGAEFV